MELPNRPCQVLASAMLVALALGAAPDAAFARDAMGEAARDLERRSAQVARLQAERRLRITREQAHARMPSTMYASTPDPAPPPHPVPVDVDIKRTSAPARISVKSGEDRAAATHFVGLFPSAADALGREGFARVVNHSEVAGEVRIDAYDDAGVGYGPVTLSIGAGETVHFNSEELETGNADKGLDGVTGAGEGDWRLELSSALELEVFAYIRTEDGFLTSMHDVVPRTEAGQRVVTFNPGRNTNQVSRLRLINPGAESAEVRIEGIDDEGASPGGAVVLSLGAGESRTVSAQALESGQGVSGALGTGEGKWRLVVSADQPIEVMSLLSSPTGHLTNLSSAPGSAADTQSAADVFRARISGPVVQSRCIHCHVEGGRSGHTRLVFALSTNPEHEALNLATFERFIAEVDDGASRILSKIQGVGHGGGVQVAADTEEFGSMERFLRLLGRDDADATHFVGLFASAADALGREGFARVVNHSEVAGEVRIDAYDDAGVGYGPVTLSIGAGETVHFNSEELETGNADKGLDGVTGAGEGDWRLELTSALELEVFAYIRTEDGFLTSMHDVVPRTEAGHRVVTFNPGRNTSQVSRLRLINPGAESAEVRIEGIDDEGASPGGAVVLSIGAGESRTVSAQALESGQGVSGALGTGEGKWRLVVSADRPIEVMSLLSSPTGHLTNLSSAPGSTADTQSAADVFRAHISGPVVQSRCIHCHVVGGRSGHTRLVFALSTNPEHEALNLATFERFIAEVDDGASRILSKIQGVGHGGGVQVAADTEEFADMQRFLRLLGAEILSAPITVQTLFDTVPMAPARKVLRRAALMFAGRVPMEKEYAAAQRSGTGLRETVRGLMTGPQFHEFLTRAANDRLLTDRNIGEIIDHNVGRAFVEFVNETYRRREATFGINKPGRYYDWNDRSQHGFRRAPVELIAHVVENDLPYTEVLTADYIMANPWAAAAYGASTTFDDPEDIYEFKPSRIVSYYREGEGFVSEFNRAIGSTRILDPGPLHTDYPHAGILNTTSFLLRYPTTATNRNRARSRWTYYHFLGLDIEKSASRTTDPVALADTNNPTMHNPACAVCHRVLDPVAGTFQNYGDEGFYKDEWRGHDSLDEFYKREDGGPSLPIRADSWRNREMLSWPVWMAAGTQSLRVVFTNPFWEERTRTGGTIFLDQFRVKDDDGRELVRREFEDLGAPIRYFTSRPCGKIDRNPAGREDHLRIWWGDAECALFIDFEAPSDGVYDVEIVAWADQYEQYEGGFAKLAVGVNGYREGDTWYRGMRVPGFAGERAPNLDNSVQWLAEKIVAEERFAEATVHFWWPALMGSEVAEPPEDEGDADFEGRLLAANAQGAEVERLAHDFRRGFHGGPAYNLKDLLVEMVLSEWFRADAVEDANPVRRIALRDAGARRLLTPEELARKTLALTGVQWERRVNQAWPYLEWPSALTDEYRLLYGGIDSDGVTKRARDITPVMAGVAKRHAMQVACAVVTREFYLRPESQWRLFGGIGQDVTDPDVIRGKLVELYDMLLGVEVTPHSANVETAYGVFADALKRRRELRDTWFDHWNCYAGARDRFFFEGILDDIILENESEEGHRWYDFDWDRVDRYLNQRDWPDPHYTAHAWVVTLAYLLMDYRYLYL